MRNGIGRALPWGALAAVAVLAGCANDTSRSTGGAQTSLSISRGTVTTLSASALGWVADLGGGMGFVDPSHVDSLIVVVSKVEVLPDSVLALHHRGEPWGPPGSDSVVERMGGGGPMGPGGREGSEFGGRNRFPFGPGGERDSLRERDSLELRDSLGWGGMDEDWYTLEVAGNARLDLMHLPTDTTHGLLLAVGTVPPGTYGGARLFLSSATVYFDTTLASDSGVVFKPDTGYTVRIPSGERAGIRTRAGFTIPSGASDVVLVFDADATVRHAVATRDGTILIVPVLGGFGHRH